MTKDQIQEIASMANTTPEIVKAVIDAYYQIRYVPVVPSGEAGHIFGAQKEKHNSKNNDKIR